MHFHAEYAFLAALLLLNLATGYVQEAPQAFSMQRPSTTAPRVNANNRQYRAPPTSPCEYKDLLTNVHDRVGVLASLDEDLRNRLERIEKKMTQFEANNLARLDSVAVQQTDFLKRLDSMEHIERLTRRQVEELKGDSIEMKSDGDLAVLKKRAKPEDKLNARAARQADVLPTMISDSTKLDSLATLLAATSQAVSELQTQFQTNITRLSNILQRRFNSLQRMQRQQQAPNFYATTNPHQPLITSCAQGAPAANGILQLQLTANSQPFYVLCEDSVLNGGWTVIQHRYNGELSFGRSWAEYKAGFGNLGGEFFIGLEKLHALTASAVHELLIQMQDFAGQQRFARYNAFAIGGEDETYALTLLGKYEGDAGDSLTYHAGSKFSTFDNDNDGCPECNCAQARMAGWWYNWCDQSNLNGKYYTTDYDKTPIYQGMYWRDFHGANYSLQGVRMLIRPVGVDVESRYSK